MEQPHYICNLKKSPKDNRDFIFASKSKNDLPEIVDYRLELQPIRNQGKQGTCYAQSTACMKEWQEKKDNNFNEYMSPQFFYNNRSNKYDDNPNNDDGMYGRDVMKLIKNIGIERRLMTAGKNKGMLDPFLPIVPEQEEFVQNLLNEIHDQFIAVVKKGRGDRLSTDESIFSGLFWDGNSAIKLGLVDNLGSVGSVARDIVGNENIVDFTTKASFGERIAERFGAGVGISFSNTVLNKFKNNTVIK